jgi:hypothetical protein
MEKNWQRCTTCKHFHVSGYCNIAKINMKIKIVEFIEIVGCRSWEESGVDPEIEEVGIKMIRQEWTEMCGACGGVGYQMNKDGINVLCPVCGGSGKRIRSNFDNLPPGVYCNTSTSAIDSSGEPDVYSIQGKV